MSSQENLSKLQKNTVIAGILAISLAGWYFLFAMDANMKSMNMEFPAPAVSIPSTIQKERAFRKDTNNSNWQRNEMFLTLG